MTHALQELCDLSDQRDHRAHHLYLNQNFKTFFIQSSPPSIHPTYIMEQNIFSLVNEMLNADHRICTFNIEKIKSSKVEIRGFDDIKTHEVCTAHSVTGNFNQTTTLE